MEKVLYINCCIREEASRSKELADCFLDAIKDRFEITELNLMKENLSYMMGDFFEERQVLLEKDDKQHPRFDYAHAFASYDKIVVAAPFWDLSFPALLKVYIENICVDGITFGCDETGMFGLCKATKMVFLTSRGGFFNDSPMEMGSLYMKTMCQFFGIDEYVCVAADGLDTGARPVADIMADAKQEALAVAKEF